MVVFSYCAVVQTTLIIHTRHIIFDFGYTRIIISVIMASITISDKTTITIYPNYVTIHRDTIKGERRVNVPRGVVESTLKTKDLIVRTPIEPEQGCVVFETNLDFWKILKSEFRGVTYIAFARFEDNTRVG